MSSPSPRHILQALHLSRTNRSYRRCNESHDMNERHKTVTNYDANVQSKKGTEEVQQPLCFGATSARK